MYNLSYLLQQPRLLIMKASPRIPLPAIAHCGYWHAIPELPVRCGTCGAMLLAGGDA